VDIWHCDAQGVYSDATDPGFNTVGQKFLRGYQETDANGQAQFLTIYPGWYNGRAVHIHFKIRTALDESGHEFTSQLFFNDDFTDVVYTQAPYASEGQRTLLNEQDGIYQQSGGLLTLNVAETGDGYAANGREALFVAREEKPDLILLDLMMLEQPGEQRATLHPGRGRDSPVGRTGQWQSAAQGAGHGRGPRP
jgi:hypothetical protein